MYRRPLRGWWKHSDFILLDIICLQCGIFLALHIGFGGIVNPYREPIYRNIAIVWTIIDFLIAVSFNSYSKVLRLSLLRQIRANLRHSFLVYTTMAAYLFAARMEREYPARLILFTSAFHLIISCAAVLLYKKLHWRRNRQDRSMLVISTLGEVRRAIENVQEDRSGTIRLIGAVVMDCDMVGTRINGVPVVAGRDTADEFICRGWVDEVYVRLFQDRALEDEVYRSMREMGVTIHIDATAYKNLEGSEFEIEKIGSSMVLSTSLKYISVWQLALKRCMDIAGGLVGSVIALIIMALVAIPLKRQSPGPVLYRSERIGRNGKRFTMLKLRSMEMDSESKKAALAAENRVDSGLMFKLDWDPRIIGNVELPDGTRKTGIGEFLRKWSLDEFPQFFNVLKGDMSLIGTRPPTPDEWERYSPHHRARLAVKPGITGMWQVSGRSKITDFEEVVRLDLMYINHWSLWLDIKILLQTVSAVLMRKGAM